MGELQKGYRSDSPFSFCRMVRQPGFQVGEGLRHVATAVTEADVTRLIVHRTRKKQDTRFVDKLFAECLHIFLWEEASEADSACIRRSPGKKIGMTGEERRKLEEIAENNLEVAIDEPLAMTEGESGKEFAGCAGTDGGVVLQGDDFLKDDRVAAGEPAKA